MKHSIKMGVAALAISAPLALVAAPAQANTGAMSSGEYWNVGASDRQSLVEQIYCDCTGHSVVDWVGGDGNNYKIVQYDAVNSTYDRDIVYTQVQYRQWKTDGTWHANYQKGRVERDGTVWQTLL